MQPKTIEREACPVCGSTRHKTFLAKHMDWRKLNEFAFASRKTPEFMNFPLAECEECGLVFATELLCEETLLSAYRQASFGSGCEADCAAATYARLIARHLPERRKLAVDIGSGNGALLPLMRKLGFEKAVGYEPSVAAFEAAPEDTRKDMINDIFDEHSIPDATADLIVVCMTLEHVRDPLPLMRNAFAKLAPGGHCLVADHNCRGTLNRVLGRKSPIIDLEHLQLFTQPSLSRLLTEAGFEVRANAPYCNCYPLSYYVNLLPLHGLLRKVVAGAAKPFGKVPVYMPLGNIFAVGRRAE